MYLFCFCYVVLFVYFCCVDFFFQFCCVVTGFVIFLLCCFVFAPVSVAFCLVGFFFGGGCCWRRRNISFIGASVAELFTLVHQVVPKISWPLTADRFIY